MSAFPIAASLLARPCLSILSSQEDTELAHIHAIVEDRLVVEGRADLERVLGALLAAVGPRPAPRTLDLIGHATPGKALLLLGEWVIDATNATVASFFRELAEQDVMARLGVRALRLIGCLTADGGQARWTIGALADILGIEVYGTNNLVSASHFHPGGFAIEREFQLVSSTELKSREIERQPRAGGQATMQVLDIDALPIGESLAPSGPWVHRLATAADVADVLRVVHRHEGTATPGLLSVPACELVFPASARGVRRMQVLLDGSFVRIYPSPTAPGIMYPVDDPRAVATLIARLPVLATPRR